MEIMLQLMGAVLGPVLGMTCKQGRGLHNGDYAAINGGSFWALFSGRTCKLGGNMETRG